MMVGVVPLDEFVATLKLTGPQRLKVLGIKGLVALHRIFMRHLPSQRARRAHHDAQMSALTGLKLKSRHTDPSRLSGGYYLSNDEIETFERDGLLGPFDVLSPEDARHLAQQANNWHANEFEVKGVMTQELSTAFRRAGTWSINYSGWFQAWRKRELWEVLRDPKITNRIASLLGNDVLLWRSHFFEKKPGDLGTFWHQSSVFRESAVADKLIPPPGVPRGMAALSAWVALSDVTVANGALRIMPGTCADGRLEYIYSVAFDEMIDFLAGLPPRELDTLITAGLFSSGSFQRAQAVFDASFERIKPMIEGREIRDLTMRAGQAVIFTELNLHASYPNTTSNETRLALGGRYTSSDVSVFRNLTHDRFGSPDGPLPFPLARLKPILVHGSPAGGVNPVVLTEPYPEDTVLRD
jgi:non-heme Fe2+,alpha-ketoglutarate-dependent halogenase